MSRSAARPAAASRKALRRREQRQRHESRALLAELAQRLASERPTRDEGPPPRID